MQAAIAHDAEHERIKRMLTDNEIGPLTALGYVFATLDLYDEVTQVPGRATDLGYMMAAVYSKTGNRKGLRELQSRGVLEDKGLVGVLEEITRLPCGEHKLDLLVHDGLPLEQRKKHRTIELQQAAAMEEFCHADSSSLHALHGAWREKHYLVLRELTGLYLGSMDFKNARACFGQIREFPGRTQYERRGNTHRVDTYLEERGYEVLRERVRFYLKDGKVNPYWKASKFGTELHPGPWRIYWRDCKTDFWTNQPSNLAWGAIGAVTVGLFNKYAWPTVQSVGVELGHQVSGAAHYLSTLAK